MVPFPSASSSDLPAFALLSQRRCWRRTGPQRRSRPRSSARKATSPSPSAIEPTGPSSRRRRTPRHSGGPQPNRISDGPPIRPERSASSPVAPQLPKQNLDFDLLSPESLMQKAIGETMTLVRTQPCHRIGNPRRRPSFDMRQVRLSGCGDHIEVLAQRRLAGSRHLRPRAPELRRTGPVGDGAERPGRDRGPAFDPLSYRGSRWSSIRRAV